MAQIWPAVHTLPNPYIQSLGYKVFLEVGSFVDNKHKVLQFALKKNDNNKECACWAMWPTWNILVKKMFLYNHEVWVYLNTLLVFFQFALHAYHVTCVWACVSWCACHCLGVFCQERGCKEPCGMNFPLLLTKFSSAFPDSWSKTSSCWPHT